MKTLIFILIILSFSVQSQVIVSDEYRNGKTLTEGKTEYDIMQLPTISPVNQIRNPEQIPKDGIGLYAVRFNGNKIGISEDYGHLFKYFDVIQGVEGVKLRIKPFNIGAIVLTKNEILFYYSFGNRKWKIITGNKYQKYINEFHRIR